MSLPDFLGAGSPPRSPHVAPPTDFPSYFRLPAPTRSSYLFRPTRRDLMLCLLTLSFSYLLFSQAPSTIPEPIPTPAPIRPYRLPKWSIFNPTEKTCPPVETLVRDTTFTESVKSYGIATPDGSGDWDSGARGWDGLAEDGNQILSTVKLGHQPGWTLFERLYVYNGSFYVVTDDQTDWPELRMMTSTGLPASSEPGNGEAREPKGDEIVFITTLEAAKLWGTRVYKMEGTSWLFNDGQFVDHYYHFAAELLLGTWRTYASLDQDITPQGETTLPPPRRIWFLHQDEHGWRDGPRFNPTILFALFPSTSILYPSDFKDLANSTSSHRPNAFMIERALYADRSAAFRGPHTESTSRTVASALYVGTASRWWWEPIRRQILRYAGVDEDVIDRNLEGYGAVDPSIRAAETAALGPGVTVFEPLAPSGGYRHVVTYISRQSSRRRLTPESHAQLVKALEERAVQVGYELVIVEAEKLTKEEQFALAARTTIMLGVHGNGLTHLVWMPATPKSAVIEIFYKGGFARDYQWTAHCLGLRHFAVHHDVTFTSPNLPRVEYPEGFQGTGITVVGKVVADLIEDRLAGMA